MLSYWYRKSYCGDRTVVRSSYISTMGFHILVRLHLFIESGPCSITCTNAVLFSMGPIATNFKPIQIKKQKLYIHKNAFGNPICKMLAMYFSDFNTLKEPKQSTPILSITSDTLQPFRTLYPLISWENWSGDWVQFYFNHIKDTLISFNPVTVSLLVWSLCKRIWNYWDHAYIYI